jgi:hypothetical protein
MQGDPGPKHAGLAAPDPLRPADDIDAEHPDVDVEAAGDLGVRWHSPVDGEHDPWLDAALALDARVREAEDGPPDALTVHEIEYLFVIRQPALLAELSQPRGLCCHSELRPEPRLGRQLS